MNFFDAPEILDCAVTPIPGSASAPLQVVASLGGGCRSIEIRDGILNRFIGIYVGPVGQETLREVIGTSPYSVTATRIWHASRVSLRSMDASPISTGSIFMKFND